MDSINLLFTPELIKRTISRMCSKTLGIAVISQKERPTNCFLGCKIVDWLISNLALTRQEAHYFGKLLLMRDILKVVSDEDEVEFLDEEIYYQLNSTCLNDRSFASSASTVPQESKNFEKNKLNYISIEHIKSEIQNQLFDDEEVVQLCTRARLVDEPKPKLSNQLSVLGFNRFAYASSEHDLSKYKSRKMLSRLKSYAPQRDSRRFSIFREILCVTAKGTRKLDLHRIHYSAGTYSILQSWSLERLESVKLVEDSESEFLIRFDTEYRFVVPSSAQRGQFLWNFFQICQSHLDWIQTGINLVDLKIQLESREFADLHLNDASRLITKEEEKQLAELIKSSSVYDLDRLSDELSKELVNLEMINIQALTKSHQNINDLCAGLKNAQARIDQIKNYYLHLKEQLDMTASSFEQIENKNNRMAMVTNNQQKLHDELNLFIAKISLDHETIRVLKSGSFSQGVELEAAILAANSLKDFLKLDLKPGLESMKAAHQQIKIFLGLSCQFSQHFCQFLNTFYKQLADSLSLSRHRATLCSHNEGVYDHLRRFQPLVVWLKEIGVDLKSNPLFEAYTDCDKVARYAVSPCVNYLRHMSPIWKKEIRSFFAGVRRLTVKKKAERLTFKMDWALAEQLGLKSSKKAKGGGNGLIESNDESENSRYCMTELPTSTDSDIEDMENEYSKIEDDIDEGGSDKYAMTGKSSRKVKKVTCLKAYTYAMSVVLPLLLEEQTFLQQYFMLTNQPCTETPELLQEYRQSLGAKLDTGTHIPSKMTTDEHGDTMVTAEKIMNVKSQLDSIMTVLFDPLESEMNSLVTRAYNLDRFNCLGIWLETGRFEQEYREKSSFITTLCENIRMAANALFEKFIDEQVSYISNTRFASVKNAEVLPHTRKYFEFLDRMDATNTMMGSSFCEAVYSKITKALFDWLCGLGEKYEMYVVRIKNFYVIHKRLSIRNIGLLEVWRDLSEKLFYTAIDGCIKCLVSQRFDFIIEFFDGIDKLYETVPIGSIQFHRAYSNQTIVRLLQKFKASDVEEGLYKSYQRIRQDFSSDHKLGECTWEHFKKYFVDKVLHFEKILSDCYKQRLSFTVDQLKDMYKLVESRWEMKANAKDGSSGLTLELAA